MRLHGSTRRHHLSIVVLAILLTLGASSSAFGALFDVLVFSKTAGFRHSCIPFGITMIQNQAAANNFTATFTEDSTQFNTANLAQYECVVFLCTTGDVLDSGQQAAFQAYIESGKGFVGIHSAADTLHSWPWYGNLVGAFFVDHPAGTPTATVEVADRIFPASSFLPKYWVRTDEWYNFDRNPRGTVHVLATVDEGTYSGGTMGYDHPIAWCQKYDGGRSFYTAGGHTDASYSEQQFMDHVLNGIKWAAGNIGGEATASVYANYQKVTLDPNVTEPMSLSVAPDNRVFFVERGGNLKIYKPTTQSTVLAGTLAVTTANEDGLLGIALDPNFATNNWVYLMYSPTSVVEQRISRFTMSGDTLNMGSEAILLHIPTQRTNCCHSAGSLAFGNSGQLYISAGDNTNPFDSAGYSPIDEQSGRSDWDAQKSASNRNDLRGKILRIVPQSNGTYTIPSGNLFPSDGSNGRPEVYVMGCRNPFRISVDTATGWLYWGEVGPDAGADSASRGPKGYDEVNQARAAGNFGWPYCIANNIAYHDYNFATGVSGSFFNCAAPTNNSPNNTGSQSLPASNGAWIWYPYGPSTQFPEMNGASQTNRTIMAGPVYHYNGGASSSVKIPQYYDNTLFVFEWSRNYINEVKIDDSGNILKINPFANNITFGQPIEMEFGPDGCMYMIEWNPAKVVRIEYVTSGNLSPVAVGSANPDTGLSPLNVAFSSNGSFDPDGSIVAYQWDFTSDGTTDSTLANPSFTYNTNGNYTAKLTVRDNIGATSVTNVPIVVGNNRPVVTITKPANGGFYDWNSTVSHQVSVTDAQDGSTGAGTIPCSSVVLQTYLGHDSHSHPMGQFTGCTGGFSTVSDQGHDLNENLYYIFEARYTDLGGPGAGPLTTIVQSVLQPKRKQAENFTTQLGIQFENCDDVGGGQDAGFIDNGDYISFSPINLQNISSITARVASPQTGANIEVRVDSPTGTLISTIPVPVTGGWQTWVDSTASVTNPGGAHQLYFVFKPNAQGGPVMNLNWVNFNGDGVGNGAIVTYDLGSPDVADSMTHPQPADGDTTPATIGGRIAKKNVNTAVDFYFYFAVDDTYALNGNRPVEYITVDYYDTGTGTLSLNYDATDGNFYKSGGSVTLTNSNTWKQVQWNVTDAYFGNRENNGADFRIFLGTNVTRYIDLVTVASNSSQGGQTPYPGSAFSVPGIIQAEQYDIGGQGVAYSDASAGNLGGQYRTSENVDIEGASDTGGGYDVGFIDSGEWMEYTINVTSAGTYPVNLRVASPNTGGAYHLELNGANLTGSKTIPNTGGWQTWTTTSAGSYAFTTGQKVLRVYVESGGWNVNYIEVTGTSPPGQANGPNPANGATLVNKNADLSWTAGSGATSHDVRFGTANPPPFIQNQAGTTYDPGTMAVNTTYFWRIDEKNTVGTTTGVVWSFTTLPLPGTASAPNPANGATGVSTSPTLSWTAGSNASSHDVRFGTANPPPFVQNQAGTSYAPSGLNASTTYFWRIDEVNTSGSTTGTVWSFTTASGAQSPFGGTAWAIPGTIQGENYDVGGEGIAYHDLTTGNLGGQYRTDNVDVETCGDTGGGFNVSHIDSGEWVEYTVNVASAGTYNINMRVATVNTGGTYHIEMNGVNVTGTMSVPNTGDWQTYTTVTSSNISLNAGQQVMRVSMDIGPWNFNYVNIQSGSIPAYFTNSGFEGGFVSAGGTYNGSVGTGWTPYVYTGVQSDLTFADETGAGNFDTGSHSQKIQAGASKEGGAYNRFSVTSGQNYTVTVRCKSGSAAAWCFFGINTSGGTDAHESSGTVYPADNGRSTSWTTFTWTGTATGSAITLFLDTYDGVGYWDSATPGGTVTISNSTFASSADGWNIVVWHTGPNLDGTMAFESGTGNPAGDMLSGGSGGTNNTDSCTREGGEINKAISTAGYNTAIQVQYDLRFNTDQSGTSCIGNCTPLEGNCADKIAVYYSTAGTGGPWTLLETLNASAVTQNVWTTRTVNCPSGVNNQANFALRFRFQFNTVNTDWGRLDNIKLIGTP